MDEFFNWEKYDWNWEKEILKFTCTLFGLEWKEKWGVRLHIIINNNNWWSNNKL